MFTTARVESREIICQARRRNIARAHDLDANDFFPGRMILKRIYDHLPNTLQSAALSAKGARIAVGRFGSLHGRTFYEMRSMQWSTSEEWKELQRKKLVTLVVSAREHVPHYRTSLRDVSLEGTLEQILAQVPVLEKSLLREAPQTFLSDHRVSRREVHLHTSGTTGAPLTIVANADAITIAWSAMGRFWSWAGVRRGDRRMSFTGNAVVPLARRSGPYGRLDRVNNRMMMSVYHLGHATADKYLDAIESFAPVFIDGYPSAIEICARRALEIGRKIRVSACFPTAETLTEEARTVIEAGLGTRIYNQYGSQEGAALITECGVGSLHVHPEVGIVEIVKSDGSPCLPGEKGDLLLTGLNNTFMPFIRYRIGDSATAVEDVGPCACGRQMPRIGTIEGRTDDVVITPDGRRLGMLSFNVFKYASRIRASQIVQQALDQITIRVVPEPGFMASDREEVVQALRERVGPAVSISFEICEQLPVGANGKRRAVINAMSKQLGT